MPAPLPSQEGFLPLILPSALRVPAVLSVPVWSTRRLDLPPDELLRCTHKCSHLLNSCV